MTNDDDTPNVNVSAMMFEPPDVAEALALLAGANLINTKAGEPWMRVFAAQTRSVQGFVLFMWGSAVGEGIRRATESRAMIQFRRIGNVQQNLQHFREAHPADVPELEWILNLLTAAGEYDLPAAQALFSAAPDDTEAYSERLGLLGVWEDICHDVAHNAETRAAAISGPTVPTMAYENQRKYAEPDQ